MKHVLITGMTPNHGGVESFIYNYVSKLQGPIIAVTLGAHIRKNSRLWDAMSILVQDMVKVLKKHVLTYKIFFRRMHGNTTFFGITLRCYFI